MNAKPNRWIAVSVSIISGMMLLSLFLWSPQAGLAYQDHAEAQTDELRVCPAGCEYSSIQAAVDAADEGDIINVATGTYTGVDARMGMTQVVYIDKSLSLLGGYSTDDWAPSSHSPTVIDAQGIGRALSIVGDLTATVSSIKLTHGMAALGGGAYVVSATARFSNTEFSINTATEGGGGLYAAQAHLDLNLTRVLSNTGLTPGVGGAGGGLHFVDSEATVTQSLIAGNNSMDGGGAYVLRGTTKFADNAFMHNTAGVRRWRLRG